MTIKTTPNYGLAYCDPDTALADLATASQQLATSVDTALGRGGITPYDATSLAAEAGARVNADNALSARVGVLEAGSVWTPYTTAADGGGLWRSVGGVTPAVGNGTLVARYIRTGKLCFIRIAIVFGSTTSGGNGPWAFGLPFTAAAGQPEADVTAKGFCAAGNFSGFGYIPSGASIVNPYLPASASTSVCQQVQNANTANSPGTGIPVSSGSFSYGATHNLILTGLYEVQ